MVPAEDKVIRQGRVILKVGSHGFPRTESFLVQEWSEGSVLYYLGAVARTSDGWVTLPEEYHKSVAWES